MNAKVFIVLSTLLWLSIGLHLRGLVGGLLGGLLGLLVSVWLASVLED